MERLLVIFLVLGAGVGGLVHADGQSPTCDPLIYREGIRVTCRASPESRQTTNCHDRSSQLSVGTIAHYACDRPFYVPAAAAASRGAGAGGGTLTCSQDGSWTGGLTRFYSFACNLNCGVTDLRSVSQFIKGGHASHAGDWPWHATLFKRNEDADTFDYFCGGSLIRPAGTKEYVVLTAAHCVVDREHGGPIDVGDVRVALGLEEPRLEGIPEHSPDAQVLRVRKIIVHRSYDGGSALQADIALIRLSSPGVSLRPNILPACLSSTVGRPSVGDVGHVAGFGVLDPEVLTASLQLRRATSPVVSPEKCAEWRSRKLNPQEYCAGSEGSQNSCFGDSGGGMVFNATAAGADRFYLHGIVSHGRGAWNGQPPNCDIHSVYTKVASYVDWIQEMVQEFGQAPPPAEGATANTSPDGSTGCSGRLAGGECWRYCSGSEGLWCYTGSDCMGDGREESCADKVTCTGYSCTGAAEGCVTTCPPRLPAEYKPLPPAPRGSTGCSRRFELENGNCWRYCAGSSGTWCYTGLNCIGNEEVCAEKTVCSGHNCDGAAADCVLKCDEP